MLAFFKKQMMPPQKPAQLLRFQGGSEIRKKLTDIICRPSNDSFSWTDSQAFTNAMSTQIFQTQEEILTLNKQFQKAQGIVGDIPSEWQSERKSDFKASDRNKIFSGLKHVVKRIREVCHGEVQVYPGIGMVMRLEDNDSNFLAAKFSKILNRAGIISNNKPINFAFVGEGNNGTVHRFDINGKTYALKIFKQKLNSMVRTKDLHGCPIEHNRAAYIQKTPLKVDFSEFFFGDINAGYMVNEYISGTLPLSHFKPKHKKLRALGLYYGDLKPENIKNGKIIDYGGMRKTNPPEKLAEWYKKEYGRTLDTSNGNC